MAVRDGMDHRRWRRRRPGGVPMSLRWKLQLVVIAILAIMALVGLAVERCAVLPRFTSLERQEAEAENAFVKKAVEHELRALHSTCCDWARWDDPYLFVAGRNPGWPAADLQPDAIATLRLDLMYICGLEGRRHWSLALDPVTGRPGTLPDFPATGLPASHPLLTEPTADGHTGIWTTRWGPMLVAAVPITTSDRESPFNGVLIMGRVLTEALVAAMPTCDGMEVRARGVGDLSWSLQEQAIAERLGAGTGSVVDEVSADRVACYSVLPDLAGKPALMLKAEIPRDATQTGRAAERLFFLAILAALIALIPATLLVLRRMVVDPITALVHHAVKVGQTSDLSARLASRRSDEIGVLAREFDAMLERMADARARLLSRSYRSGMAEGMTGTLHGVRNALTPAVVSVAEAREQLRAARPERIAAAARELARTDLNESRREDLNAYVQLAGTRLLDVMSGVED
ncbi:MAG: HAMP domain-containing protein, partial [Chloroflexi bacterium]|nr:HAMP domain-containing protein [Chloroflexota bacterium]